MVTQKLNNVKMETWTRAALRKYLDLLNDPSIVLALMDKRGFSREEINDLKQLNKGLSSTEEKGKVEAKKGAAAVEVAIVNRVNAGMTLQEAYADYFSGRGKVLEELAKEVALDSSYGLV